ncbi:MAG TPA: Ig-like domain-containing protein [Anaerolineaceae bacterium]|nr:Ig-like domain-containing protein [Anaerolineaceae bacterium]
MQTSLKKSLFFYVLILVLVLALVNPSCASTHSKNASFSVNTLEDSHDLNLGNGLCADIAGICSLRAAIEESNTLTGLDTITLPEGTYNLVLGQLEVTDDLTINGMEASTTIISGQNLSRVFKIDKPGGTNQISVILNDVTIEAGNTDDDGGGIWNDEKLTIQDSYIRNNVATTAGGGIYNFRGQLVMSNGTVAANTIEVASYNSGGGGICNIEGNVTLTNTNVINNAGYTDYSAGGGGISNSHGSLTLVSSNVNNNTMNTDVMMASVKGGGIYSFYGNITIIDTNINDNVSLGSETPAMAFGSGGGMSIYEGETIINDSNIIGNESDFGGGGIENSYGAITILDSKIDSNISSRGGGIASNGADVIITIRNSSITNNSSDGTGGGIDTYYGTISLIESTISNNSAATRGSGLLLGDESVLKVSNSTISGNGLVIRGNAEISHSTIDNPGNEGINLEVMGAASLRNTILAANCSNNITSLGYNLISDPTNCALVPVTGDVVGLDPMLAVLANYGGNTNTHALLSNSPAIDAGVCTDIGDVNILTDQRGASRHEACDIGAYEYAGTITNLSSDNNPASVGETVLLTATVLKGEPEAITGVVIFYDQFGMLGSSTLDVSGQAEWTLSALSSGTHFITAEYQGNSVFAGSTSELLKQVVIGPIYLPLIIR